MKIKPIDLTNGSKLINKDVITCTLEFWDEKDPKMPVERIFHVPSSLVIKEMISCFNL